MSSLNPRYPIEVRYFLYDAIQWCLWSHHRSRAAAERAFREICCEEPDADVQMRHDRDGVIKQRFAAKRPAYLSALDRNDEAGARIVREVRESTGDVPGVKLRNK